MAHKAAPKQKNPLSVDLGFFGKLDENGGTSSKKFFNKIEKTQDPETVQQMRDLFQEALENNTFPRIERQIQNFLKKQTTAESAGRLKQLMRNIASEGLVSPKENHEGKVTNYRRNPDIDRTGLLVNGYHKRKEELKKRYAEIMNKPNGVRVEGFVGKQRFAFVASIEFGENKNGQETVIIADILPLHGPPPSDLKASYVVGYSVPKWLKGQLTSIKQKVAKAKNREEEKALKAKAAQTEEPTETSETPDTKLIMLVPKPGEKEEAQAAV
jgi:hypothetical protein